MLEALKSLTWADYIYAAIMAFVLMRLITNVGKLIRMRHVPYAQEEAAREFDRKMMIQNCATLLPEATIHFRGRVFQKGMQVRITTLQKRIIEGELIGKNDKGLLCVIAGPHIIAHEIDKIEDMVEMPPYMERH